MSLLYIHNDDERYFDVLCDEPVYEDTANRHDHHQQSQQSRHDAPGTCGERRLERDTSVHPPKCTRTPPFHQPWQKRCNNILLVHTIQSSACLQDRKEVSHVEENKHSKKKKKKKKSDW